MPHFKLEGQNTYINEGEDHSLWQGSPWPLSVGCIYEFQLWVVIFFFNLDIIYLELDR